MAKLPRSGNRAKLSTGLSTGKKKVQKKPVRVHRTPPRLFTKSEVQMLYYGIRDLDMTELNAKSKIERKLVKLGALTAADPWRNAEVLLQKLEIK